jgi:signal peptidase II
MQQHLKRLSFLGALVAVVVVADQWTKWLIVESFVLEESVSVISGFFEITHIRNFGAAFGMFSQMSTLIRQLLLLALPIGILIFLCVLFFWKDFQSKFTTLALSLIIAGAIGNMIDRIVQGYVVDFLHFNVGFMWWPAFNVADACVSVGGVMLMIFFTFIHKPSHFSKT